MLSFTELFSIALGAILVNNFIFAQFLGICPFMGVSKKIDTAMHGRYLRHGRGQRRVLAHQPLHSGEV